MIWIQGFILLLICKANWMFIPQFQWFRSSSSASFHMIPHDSMKKNLCKIERFPFSQCETIFFPTCQVRVLRFYQSCCPPPHPPPYPPPPPPPPVSPRPCLHQLPLPPPLPPCQLFAKLFANFRDQCALLDLNLGPSQLSAHRWTSTWDLPSSVRTAGPQPGTFPAQCAPLDLNGQIECQKICQIECQMKCQKICQIKCHKMCQIKCQKICQIEC